MESGEKFWTGAKRFPRAADLEMSEEQHAAFVLATANLLAAGCGLSPQEEGLLPLEHPQRDVEGTCYLYFGLRESGVLCMFEVLVRACFDYGSTWLDYCFLGCARGLLIDWAGTSSLSLSLSL